MNEKTSNEDFDIELGLQSQSDWKGEQIEDIPLLDCKQGADKHIRNPEVTVEPSAGELALEFLHINVEFVVRVNVILLKGCACLLAVMDEDRELRDAIRDSDYDCVATDYVTNKIVDFVADTGRRIFGRTVSTRQVPDDVEAAKDLLA